MALFLYDLFICMLAVIETGGKQYTVSPGDTITVEKLSEEKGDTVTFPHVLLTSDGNNTEIGTPLLETTVEGKVVEHGKADKIRVFKMKSKKRYQKTQGHRQQYTKVEITKIGGKAAPKKESVEKKPAPKTPESKAKTTTKKSTTKKATPKKTATKKTTAKKSTKEK